MVGPSGLEPPTLRLSVARSSQLSYGPVSSTQAPYPSLPPSGESSLISLCLLFDFQTFHWFENRVWTGLRLGGDSRDRTGDLLLARQALSQLSYIPNYLSPLSLRIPSKLNNVTTQPTPTADQDVTERYLTFRGLLRKEVIQPLVLERLPCYDFTPIIEPTFGRALLIG